MRSFAVRAGAALGLATAPCLVSCVPLVRAAVAKVAVQADCDRDCVSILSYSASPGERLDALIADAAPDGVRITERRARLTAGPGCTADADGSLVCRADPDAPLADVVIRGGAHGNAIDASAVTEDEVDEHGGAGPDRLTGASGPVSLLLGAGGADTMTATSAGATADFADAAHGVHADLGRQRATGPGVDVRMQGVTNLEGSPGDDVLIGTPAANDIFGGAGRDRIEGRGGDDTLGADGSAVITGGSGHATLGDRGDDSSGTEAFVPRIEKGSHQLLQCGGPGDAASVEDQAAQAVGSGCRHIINGFQLMSLDGASTLLDAAEPVHDRIVLPVYPSDELPAHARYEILVTRGHEVIGHALARPAAEKTHVTVRLNRRGRRELAHLGAMSAMVDVRQVGRSGRRYGPDAIDVHFAAPHRRPHARGLADRHRR